MDWVFGAIAGIIIAVLVDIRRKLDKIIDKMDGTEPESEGDT